MEIFNIIGCFFTTCFDIARFDKVLQYDELQCVIFKQNIELATNAVIIFLVKRKWLTAGFSELATCNVNLLMLLTMADGLSNFLGLAEHLCLSLVLPQLVDC